MTSILRSAEKSRSRTFRYPSRAMKRAVSVSGGSAASRQRTPTAVHPARRPDRARVMKKARKKGRNAILHAVIDAAYYRKAKKTRPAAFSLELVLKPL